jgi:hypothetical protein
MNRKELNKMYLEAGYGKITRWDWFISKLKLIIDEL